MKQYLLFFLFLLSLSYSTIAQQVINLPNTSATIRCYPITSTHDSIQNVAIVCPGGSYCWLGYNGEGIEVAQWLQSQGITAYVLRYRVAGWWAWATHYRLVFRGHRHPDPLNDALAAINYIDSVAKSKHETVRIGIMGFSAGGHLSMHTALSDSRIAWAAPIYPVVSMSDRSTHTRSRRGLLGDSHTSDTALCNALSIEKMVSKKCPPVFLIACKDDPVVDYRNSILLDSALTANNIQHKFTLYNTGGHGFGVSEKKGTAESRQWKDEFIKWFKSLFESNN